MSRATLTEALENLLATNRDNLKQFAPFLDAPYGRTIYNVPNEFVGLLEAEPEIREFSGRLLNWSGRGGGTLAPVQIGNALVDWALSHGAQSAVDELYAFLSTDCNRSIEVALLRGIEVTETVELFNGVFIAPLDRVPSSTLQSYLATVSQQTGMTRHMAVEMTEFRKPGCALFRVFEARPKFFDDLSDLPDLSSDEHRLIEILTALLTLAGPCSPAIFKSYTELEDGQLMKEQTGWMWSVPQEETKVSSNIAVSVEQIRELVPIIYRFFELSATTREALSIPLLRLNEAVRRQQSVSRAVDLGIALESLLLTDSSNNTLFFSVRGAWLLGKDVEDRARIVKQLKRLYKYRSEAVHSGKLSVKKPSDVELIEKELKDGLIFCATAIKRIIDHGDLPQWDSILIGGDFMAGDTSDESQ
ncbi:hypothetical protein [Paraburkholderia phytofirmans]|uniref:hypothetical protein n=1 Tax=Paraburkholderia phytofirmans TaxID=261302 RepID=UPI0038BB6131